MYDAESVIAAPLTMESYDTSLVRILAEAATTQIIHTSIQKAIGQTLAEDLVAPISVPSFDNSAMDGFAFAAASVQNASSTQPAILPIVGASIAGDTAGLSHLQPGHAAKIMTGAPLPEGADTILSVERASWDHEKLTFYEPYPMGKHVRLVGQDVAAGTIVLEKGTRMSTEHIPLLCALGLSRIAIYQAPRVSWITTGQEISDRFDEPLEPGHIYNATGLYGTSLLKTTGLNVDNAVTVRDTPQDFAAALEDALAGPSNLILSTGGVSAGQYDFVRPVLEDFGADIIVHKARIKPGKPILFARLPGGKYFFGLPGNPISTALGLRVFVYPFIRKMMGLGTEPFQKAVLADAVSSTDQKTVFLMGNVHTDELGAATARLHENQKSFQTAPFAKSNAWIISPEGVSEHASGSFVSWIPISP